jgi:hypothetical protein
VGLEVDERYGDVKDGTRDETTEGENFIRMPENNGSGSYTLAKKLEQGKGAGAGTSSAGHDEYFVFKELPTERMMAVDDFTSDGVGATPKGQAYVADQQVARSIAFH